MARPPGESAGSASVFPSDLARVAVDPLVRQLAMRRAGSRELAEDALQETYSVVARVKNPEDIRDLRAFFCRSLIREIDHQRARSTSIPVGDIEDVSEAVELGRGHVQSDSLENMASVRILADALLTRFERDRDQLMASVPGRSNDHRRYRMAIVEAAKKILLLLLEGHVSSADWNAILKSEYPQWCNEPGLTRNGFDQRISRSRRDVQDLLRQVAPFRGALSEGFARR